MSHSLLIVDDDRNQLTEFARHFHGLGYHVVSVHHPRMALQVATIHQFQAAVIGLCLPDMDSLELAKRLGRYQEAMQVIILSRYRHPASADGTSEIFAWLEKPCKVPRLQKAVEQACDRASNSSIDSLPTRQSLQSHVSHKQSAEPLLHWYT